MPGDARSSRDIAGLDALELATDTRPSRGSRLWAATWPKLAAVTIALAGWQAFVWTEVRPRYTLRAPSDVLPELVRLAGTPEFWSAIATTMQRAGLGFLIATVIGLVVGVATARLPPLRAAIGSLITGLQTMPSIAWFPLAIALFQISEAAMYFVVILGATPSVANGVINGVDYVPPLLKRVGRNLGAGGMALYRHIILPAALPSIIAGLKQGWAFAWRSLMAGELLVGLGVPAIGERLDTSRQLNAYSSLMAWMIVILIIGILVDALFGWANATIRRRWGLVDSQS